MLQNDVNKVINWKAPEDKDDPALEFPPKDDTPAAQAPAPKPKAKAKPKAKPKAKGKGMLSNQLGWFIETVPVHEENGTIVSDRTQAKQVPCPKAKNANEALKVFKELAATSPDSVSHHAVRIMKVEKAFLTKTRTIVDIEE